AANDLSASVQYVHDQTGQNLHYVGYSLGTLMALAAFSKQQSMNNPCTGWASMNSFQKGKL
ncbi:hypothetical protein ACR8G9_22790, partial [Salmonella enterica subsp. enterica serovar Paratyphi A]